MVKVVVGGQINKQEIYDLILSLADDKFDVQVKSDLDAAMDIKSGAVDYYFGACNTGGGGALAMAIALAGSDKCVTLSMPGNIKPEEEMIQAVNDGKVAFGFTAQHIEQVVPVLVKAIIAKEGV